MSAKHLTIAALTGLLGLGIAASARAAEPHYIGTYRDIGDTSFVIETLADREVLGVYTICKALQMVLKMPAARRVGQFALSYPIDIEAKTPDAFTFDIPPNWAAIRATAYVIEPFPDETHTFDIVPWTTDCRHGFSWFR